MLGILPNIDINRHPFIVSLDVVSHQRVGLIDNDELCDELFQKMPFLSPLTIKLLFAVIFRHLFAGLRSSEPPLIYLNSVF